MKNIIRYTSVALIAAAAPVAAYSQDLSAEITVDRTIVPLEQAVKPLPSVVPSLLPQNVSKIPIRLAEYSTTAVFGPSSGKMETPVYTGLPTPETYPGYVWAGYFPAYNLGIGAGYRLINTKNTLLGVSAQFDGYSYDSDIEDDEKKVSSNTFAGQAYLMQALGRNLRLNAEFNGAGASQKAPAVGFHDGQKLTMFDARLGLEGSSNTVVYDVSFLADYFKVGLDATYDTGDIGIEYYDPKDVRYGLDGRVRYKGGSYGLELGVEALLRQCDGEDIQNNAQKGKNSGLYSFNPAFTLIGEKGELRIGARLDVTSGTDNGSFHVAPDVMFAMRPDSRFTLYARLGGGERFNTLSAQYEYSPFAPVWAPNSTSFSPVDGRAGFVVGPFSGLTVDLYARYAATRRAQMLLGVYSWGTPFMPVNLSGWGAGADIRFSPASFLDISLNAAYNPHSFHSGFADTPDRAKAVLKAAVDIRPIDKLNIGLGYELRSGRRYYWVQSLEENSVPVAVGMHNVSDLSLSASYHLLDELTIFGRGENLLGHRFYVLPGLTGQKVHGLVGILYRF